MRAGESDRYPESKTGSAALCSQLAEEPGVLHAVVEKESDTEQRMSGPELYADAASHSNSSFRFQQGSDASATTDPAAYSVRADGARKKTQAHAADADTGAHPTASIHPATRASSHATG